MWFLTIESIALLAVATTLGLFAGWLVWGGKPAVISARAPNSAAASLTIAPQALAEPLDPELGTVIDQRDGEPMDPPTMGRLTSDTRLSPDEIDPGAIEALAESEFGLEAPQGFPGPYRSAPSADETVLDLLGSSLPDTQDVSAFPSVASSNSVRLLELEAAQLREELDQLSARLETREADVVRLKAKLRKAVEEIEKRTALAQAARAELVEHQQRLAQSQVATSTNEGSERDDFAPVGTRFTSAEIDELVQARTASLQIQTSQLERRTALIQSRAEEAEARVVALKAEAARQQAETDAAFAKAEQESADRILALEVDLASARQRTNMATQELMGFGTEISAIRDTNAKHLQSVHETMRDLQHRLDTAKAALAGRSISAVKSATVPATTSLSDSTLMVLPGMTVSVVDSLAELGIFTLADVASWTNEDVDHIQSLLPENPDIVERNGWVAVAQRSLREPSSQSEV